MASCLVIEFERHFLVQELFNTTRVIYPSYSLAPKVETTFRRQFKHISNARRPWVVVETLCDHKWTLSSQSIVILLEIDNVKPLSSCYGVSSWFQLDHKIVE